MCKVSSVIHSTSQTPCYCPDPAARWKRFSHRSVPEAHLSFIEIVQACQHRGQRSYPGLSSQSCLEPGCLSAVTVKVWKVWKVWKV